MSGYEILGITVIISLAVGYGFGRLDAWARDCRRKEELLKKINQQPRHEPLPSLLPPRGPVTGRPRLVKRTTKRKT